MIRPAWTAAILAFLGLAAVATGLLPPWLAAPMALFAPLLALFATRCAGDRLLGTQAPLL